MRLLIPERDAVVSAMPVALVGRVSAVRGLTILVDDLPIPVGSLVRIHGQLGDVLGEVIGFDHERSIVMLLGDTIGVSPGDDVRCLQRTQTAPIGDLMLGRIIDGLGRPIDGKGQLRGCRPRSIAPPPLSAMQRGRIDTPLRTGVRAIDLMAPLGVGQRMGVFAGPGVGKSSLLAQIARGTSADISVIALIGERGREVREFIEHTLGDAIHRCVVVVATGDESPLLRVRAAKLACSVAEHFRDGGSDVLLMMDSVTRFAHAQRQIGLATGEPPATKGYTPSVFSSLATLLERAGGLDARRGSVTGLYTVLVEGDDMTEPIADAARGILDGHLMLSRRLAQRGHFPAIDVMDSVSRVADHVVEPAHRAAMRQVSSLLARYAEVEDLVQVGAYAKGANVTNDVAIEMNGRINELLTQTQTETEAFESAAARMLQLAIESGEQIQSRQV